MRAMRGTVARPSPARAMDDLLAAGERLAAALERAGCVPEKYGREQHVAALFEPPVPDMWIAWKAIAALQMPGSRAEEADHSDC